jgi:hypothetical protein
MKILLEIVLLCLIKILNQNYIMEVTTNMLEINKQ